MCLEIPFIDQFKEFCLTKICSLSEMDTEVPEAPVQKKAPAKRAAAPKKTLATVSETVDLDDDDDEIDDDEDFVAPAKGAAKKGGRKPAANTKAATSKAPAAAATKRRGGANKEPQLLGQKLLTDMLKPAENSGISPDKKVRKMRASPFNKKSGSMLGRAVAKDIDDEATTASEEKSSSSSPSTSESVDEVVEVPAPKARPQRANRRQTRYVLSDSESEKGSDDSDFDETDGSYAED